MIKITEYLPKPLPSPAPEIFDVETIEIVNENNSIQKIEVYKEFSETFYNTLSYNSKMLAWTLKSKNLSWHHLYFVIKIYSISSNQNLIFKTISSAYCITNILH